MIIQRRAGFVCCEKYLFFVPMHVTNDAFLKWMFFYAIMEDYEKQLSSRKRERR